MGWNAVSTLRPHRRPNKFIRPLSPSLVIKNANNYCSTHETPSWRQNHYTVVPLPDRFSSSSRVFKSSAIGNNETGNQMAWPPILLFKKIDNPYEGEEVTLTHVALERFLSFANRSVCNVKVIASMGNTKFRQLQGASIFSSRRNLLGLWFFIWSVTNVRYKLRLCSSGISHSAVS